MATEKQLITFRLDASHRKGMGHLYRMKTLAGKFREHGFDCLFILREDDIAESILDTATYYYASYPIEYSEAEIITHYFSEHVHPDLWIFDILETEREWVLRVKSQQIPVICFDDLNGGVIEADLVINAIAGCWKDKSLEAHILSGPQYAIINPDILTLCKQRFFLKEMFSVGVTLGGSDTHGATIKIAQVLAEIKDIQVTFFLGPHFLHDEELKKLFPQFSCQYSVKKAVRNLHKELAEIDIIICGGGQTLFELCAMGKPVLAIANEPHEEQTIEYFARYRACINLGSIHKELEPDILYHSVTQLRDEPERGYQLSLNAQQLVDGKGLARCYQACLKFLL